MKTKISIRERTTGAVIEIEKPGGEHYSITFLDAENGLLVKSVSNSAIEIKPQACNAIIVKEEK